ncbi:YhdP family protein [Thalassotalea ponticola]|uniref:YhdP family protein n=1 Tax=Thalassotalea ponticola TaxID=1523392 RepID=UPI0025B591BE|nr:YhdP family protein [Thalassotalea ponticola]MDN3653503.1 YhdP family protein [Thalassotalea ponticola]
MNAFWAGLNRWLNRLYKTLAVLLVLLAVIITSARILLPHAPAFKQELEQAINNRFDGQISIGELSAGWHRLGPTLILRKVVLLNANAMSLEVDEIDVGVDFWHAIRRQSLRFHDFTLKGATLTFDQTQHQYEAKQSATDLDAMYDIIFSQVSRFSVVNSRIVHINSQQRQTMRLRKLAWHNDGELHQGVGAVELDDLGQQTAKLLIELRGDARQQLQGQIYLAGSDLDLSYLISEQLGEQAQSLSSQINFQTWLYIDQGQLTQAHLNLGDNTLSWRNHQQQHQLTLNQGNVSVYRTQAGQAYQLVSSPLALQFDQQAPTDVSVTGLFNQAGTTLRLSDIDLAKVWPIVGSLTQLSEQAEAMAPLNLRGTLSDIALFANDRVVKLTTDFHALGIDNTDAIPGVEQLSGKLWLNNNALKVDLLSTNSALDFGDRFRQPIAFDQLNANVRVDWQQGQWSVQVDKATMRAEQLQLNADLQYQVGQQEPALLSLYATVENADASNVANYLPLHLMSPKLVDYLTGAIKQGQIKQAQVLVNGPVKNFPFRDNSGIFTVQADVEQADYAFAPSWPDINDADLHLNFTNESMLITASKGTLSGIAMDDVKVAIADLSKNAVLTVRTPVTTQASNVQALMNASPLAKSVGETLNTLGAVGEVKGQFSLDLPLADMSSAVAKGTIEFRDNELQLATPSMHFTQVNGQLTFINDQINAQDVYVRWRDMPISLDVSGERRPDFYQLGIDINALWQEQDTKAQIPASLQAYLQGDILWQGNLNLFITDDNISYQFDANSLLNEATLSLPAPYHKQKGTDRALTVKVKGSKRSSAIEAKYANNLSFSGVLDHDKVTFRQAQLVLGQQQMLLPMDGFHVIADLASIEYDSWQRFVFDLLATLPSANSSEQSHSVLPAPERIRGDIGQVNLYGLQVDNVDFNLLAEEDWWLLQLDSKQMRGRVKFYHQFSEQGIDIDADFIRFEADSEDTDRADKSVPRLDLNNSVGELTADVAEQSQLQPSDIPSLRFKCDSCRFKQFDFGEVDLALEKNNDTMISLSRFNAERKNLKLQLSGSWIKTATRDATQVSGTVQTNEIEKELARFDIESGIKDSGLRANYELRWQGGPHQFNVDSLYGSAKGRLDDGYLAKVSDQGARLFSIFSLQSLLRKLTLDFRDIFSKGMFYSDFKGDFAIAEGVIYTDNLKMDGAAGNLTIKGNTNLVNNQLDYKMLFAPKVTSSLPILAWLVNPIAGAAAIVINEAIEQAEVVAAINFELTGTVDEPSLKEVNRKTRNVNVGKSRPDNPEGSEPQAPDNANVERSNPQPAEPIVGA